tara:strand:- start:20364 stop:20873 length:510 start_codon:yes stop_codon:yes gene_type:complete
MPAIAQKFYTETGKAVFTSKVPLHTFSGTSENLTGMIDLDKNTVDFYIDLATLDTGNGKRDKDMRLTLETEEYPFGEFFGTLNSDFDPGSKTEQEVTTKGKFRIHGKEKEIEVKGTLTPVDGALILKASWILKLEDYDIVPPQLLFMKVDQEQEIEIEARLEKVEGNDE